VSDAARPLRIVLEGTPDPLEHPELVGLVAGASAAGAQVELRTTTVGLTPGRAHALLMAGLTTLTVPIPSADAERFAARTGGRSLAATLREVERLVAMRDANRKPGPAIRFAVETSPDDPQVLLHGGARAAVEALATARFDGVRVVAVRAAPPDVRPAGGEAHGAAPTVNGRAPPGARPPGHPVCLVPWNGAYLGADGRLSPCRRHASARPPAHGGPEPFAAWWNGAAMRALRAEMSGSAPRNPVCAACGRDDRGLG